MNSVTVVGAGPAGLASALTLAKAGWSVEVYEKNAAVGQRFHGDFQGLENWSHEEDILRTLTRLGLQVNFWIRPFHQATFYDARLRPHELQTRHPLFYLVRRGDVEGSLERGLYRQALEAGVRFHFGSPVDRVEGPAIISTGPRFGDAICVGYLFETDLPDGAWCIVSQQVAPRGYSYLLVAEGQATISSCQFTDLPRWRTHLEATVTAFRSLHPFEMKNARPFSGYGNIYLQRHVQVGQKRYVGEAAGLQDALWGFGMRYALTSGVLAARSLTDGHEEYPASIDRELRAHQQASLVNRLLWEALGDWGFSYFIHKFAAPRDARPLLGKVGGPHWLKNLLYPIARWRLSRRGRYRYTSCDREDCTCVWCTCERSRL